MEIIVDTSVIVAMTMFEPTRAALIAATDGADLFAPLSLHWEFCNALTSLMRRKQISLSEAQRALSAYETISIRFVDVPHDRSLALSAQHNIYAYDAYFVVCAQIWSAPLLTVDRGLARVARLAGIELVEVTQ